MTREEERIKQIEQFASQCYEDGERYSSFIAGAIWADNNPAQGVVNMNDVWHDASEEPAGDNWEILCVDIHNGCWVDSRVNALLLHNMWDEYADIELVKMWAYISDLLPKGGEK